MALAVGVGRKEKQVTTLFTAERGNWQGEAGAGRQAEKQVFGMGKWRWGMRVIDIGEIAQRNSHFMSKMRRGKVKIRQSVAQQGTRGTVLPDQTVRHGT